MATDVNIIVNKVDGSVDYNTTPANYVTLDLVNDYLIWTEGNDINGNPILVDGEDEPTVSELNLASTIIDADDPVTVAKCFVFDKDDGAGKIQLIDGMGDNERYVFGFSFDGATASEPQLEAWDTTDHDSTDFHVLGAGTPANSMLKAVCTTAGAPGSAWSGSALAGASNILQLNNGSGGISDPGSGNTAELYCNLKIVIPADYATPAVEPFILSVRYTWN